MARKFDYYDIRKTLKSYPDAHYYVVFGERSNGKTFSALDYALEKYRKTGEQFAYIRRYGEDIRPKNLTNLFAGHVDSGRVAKIFDNEWSLVDYTRSKFYLAKTEEDKHIVAEEPIGFAFDLNSMEHFKSTSFPKITTIIFDEFMSRSGYLPNEWVLFANSLSTIIRLRSNVKIIMLGNTVNKFCPYFQEMGLTHIKEMKPGDVDVYRYGTTNLEVVCEYTGSSKKTGGKDSDVYFAFDNPELKMITAGDWEIAIYPHLNVKIRPKDIVANFFIDFNGELLHGEIYVCVYPAAVCRDPCGRAGYPLRNGERNSHRWPDPGPDPVFERSRKGHHHRNHVSGQSWPHLAGPRPELQQKASEHHQKSHRRDQCWLKECRSE